MTGDPIPFRPRPGPRSAVEIDLDPAFRGGRALDAAIQDIIRARVDFANLGRAPEPVETLATREDHVRAAAWLVLRIEAMDERAAGGAK